MDRNREFDEEENLGFSLLSDPDKVVAGLLGAKRFGPVPNKRVTFVIGTDQRIIKVIKSETNMKAHSAEAIDALRSMS